MFWNHLLRPIVAGLALMLLAASSALAAPETKCPDLSVGKCTVQLPTGIVMAYTDTGGGHGTPVILIHGFTDTIRTWQSSLVHLRTAHPEWRILAVDLRGHGGSSMPPAAQCAAAPEHCFRVADHAADIVAFMHVMKIDKANVVGHSLGSLITQEVALSNPAMVERAILIATSTTVVGNPVIRDFLMRDTIEAMWKPELESKGKQFPRDLYNLPLREVHPKIEEWLTTAWGADPVGPQEALVEYVKITLNMSAGPWVGIGRAVQQVDNGKRLIGLKTPTLVIWGTQDGVFFNTPDQAAIKEALAGAAKANHTTNYWKQYGEVPLPSSGAQESDIGHTVQEDAPDMVAADIGSFFATGAPTADWVHSDKVPDIQKLIVERGKAPLEKFSPEF